MLRRTFVWALLAASAVIASGCSKSEGGSPQGETTKGGSGGPTNVTLALNWVPEPEFGGFYAARDTKAYEKSGLNVDIRGGGAGAPVVQMVATGQVEFGIAGADEVLTARARGADIVPIFAVFQTSPQGIMAHAARGAKTLAEVLASGTVAMELGHPYAAFLKKKLGGFGAKVVPYDGGVARFVADKDFAQQCFVTAEPLAAKKKGAEPAVFLIADEGWNPYTVVVITRRALWKEKPELVRSFAKATREGWVAYLADPGPTNAAMGKLNPAMDAEMMTGAAAAQKPLIETAETAKAGLGSMSKERWETLGKQLVDIGVIEKVPVVAEFWVDL